ncbi:hypothetical protein PHET_08908 [Paragonimus heterotremus]|uniref:Alpha-type protein kinase domain-containing protein n=1 Tax=Paragonimus heterotremus TaxID=100268 RepID=A0A8J4WUP7_9TREM|nr:hypothetical protein PHET_08908 [Paragonimus heterotremus]
MMESESLDDSGVCFSPDDVFTAFADFRISDKIKLPIADRRKFSVKELKILRSEIGTTCLRSNNRERIIGLWRTAYAMVLRRGDPWAKFELDKLPVETAKRYRYSAVKAQWVEDTVRVRIEQKSFGRGAMRECFRVKKLSNFTQSEDWSHAANFVAKRYIEHVEPCVYFDDVRLQMDAKLWAEEFSRQPAILKKVDIAQMCVLEFVNRQEKPLYHLEHFIEGTYRKYNSNSGFVDETARNTPQARKCRLLKFRTPVVNYQTGGMSISTLGRIPQRGTELHAKAHSERIAYSVDDWIRPTGEAQAGKMGWITRSGARLFQHSEEYLGTVVEYCQSSRWIIGRQGERPDEPSLNEIGPTDEWWQVENPSKKGVDHTQTSQKCT